MRNIVKKNATISGVNNNAPKTPKPPIADEGQQNHRAVNTIPDFITKGLTILSTRLTTARSKQRGILPTRSACGKTRRVNAEQGVHQMGIKRRNEGDPSKKYRTRQAGNQITNKCCRSLCRCCRDCGQQNRARNHLKFIEQITELPRRKRRMVNAPLYQFSPSSRKKKSAISITPI
ncbi:MAG: hypothetical protein R3C68_09510 [Myxococcota bacterium]